MFAASLDPEQTTSPPILAPAQFLSKPTADEFIQAQAEAEARGRRLTRIYRANDGRVRYQIRSPAGTVASFTTWNDVQGALAALRGAL
jgi:hypothetical protein